MTNATVAGLQPLRRGLGAGRRRASRRGRYSSRSISRPSRTCTSPTAWRCRWCSRSSRCSCRSSSSLRIYRQHAVRLMKQSLGFRIAVWLGVAAAAALVARARSTGPSRARSRRRPTSPPGPSTSSRRTSRFNHFERLLGINVDRIGGVQVWAQFRSALLNSIVTSLAATIALRRDVGASAAMPSRG